MNPTYDSLMPKALNYLSFRPRSIKEVEIFLEKKTKDVDLIQRIILRLQEMNYLDDKKFAAWFVGSYHGKKAKGKQLLLQLLQKKGIQLEIISEILEDVSETAAIGVLIEKKLKTVSHLPLLKQKQRLYLYLQSRGFFGEEAYRLVDEYTKKPYNIR